MALLVERRVRRLREAEDLQGLIDLLSHRDEGLRREAAAALGSLKDPRALPALAEALPQVPSAAAAIGAIVVAAPPGTAWDPRETEIVVHALVMQVLEPSWRRGEALKALQRLGGMTAVPTLLAAVDATPRGHLAAHALCELSDPLARENSYWSSESSYAESGGLRLRQPEVYWRIFHAAASDFQQPLGTEVNDDVRKWLCHVLIPTTVEGLIDQVQGPDPARQALARRILSQDGWDRTRREQIGALLGAKDPAARRVAVTALAGAGGEASRRRLLDASRDEDDAVRDEALDALAELGAHPDTTDRMLEALTDPAWRVRSGAVYYFSSHPDRRAVPWLIAMLAESGRRPWSLANALARARDPRAIPALRALLHRDDADASERASAISALAALNDRESVPHLRRLLSHREPEIRDAAAAALKKLGEGDQTGRYGPEAWRWQVKLAAALGLIAAAPLTVFWVLPLSNEAWAEDHIDWFGGGLMLAIAAAAVFGGYAGARANRRLLRTPRWVQIAIALLIVPVVFALAGLALKPMHDRQANAARVFDAYTHRFPDGRLGAKFIDLDEGSQTNMCAGERGNTAFCVAVDHNASPGRQVIGGYRLDYDASDEFGPAIIDCFGDLGCQDG